MVTFVNKNYTIVISAHKWKTGKSERLSQVNTCMLKSDVEPQIITTTRVIKVGVTSAVHILLFQVPL